MNLPSSGPDVEAAMHVGFVTSSPRLQRWQLECIQMLLSLPESRCTWLMPEKPSPFIALLTLVLPTLRTKGLRLAVQAFQRGCPAFAPVPEHEIPSSVRRQSLVMFLQSSNFPRRSSVESPSSPDETTETTGSIEVIDWIIDFSGLSNPDRLATHVRQGVLYFVVDGLPGTWENAACGYALAVLNQRPVLEVSMYALLAWSGHMLLRSGYYKSWNHSPSLTLSSLFQDLAQWPYWYWKNSQDSASQKHEAKALSGGIPWDTLSGAMSRTRWMDCFRFFLTVVARQLSRQWRRHFAEDWNIGLIRKPIHEVCAMKNLRDVEWLPNKPAGCLYADPFGVWFDRQLHVFFEKLRVNTWRGQIVHLQWDSSRAPTPSPVLQHPIHLAYPFVLEEAGEIYCVPDTHEACEIRLYRATGFPEEWELVEVLVRDLAAVDATLWQMDGRWWMACSVVDHNPDTKLLLFYAPALTGPWIPHQRNPVKIDIRSARPAGTVFAHQGQWFRPGQDCSQTYGGRVRVHRIVELTPSAYEEELAYTLSPSDRGPYPDGVHTLSQVGNYTLVDGKVYRRIPHALESLLKQRLLCWARPLLTRN